MNPIHKSEYKIQYGHTIREEEFFWREIGLQRLELFLDWKGRATTAPLACFLFLF